MSTTETYGPNGQAVAALLDRIRRMTPGEIDAASAASASQRGGGGVAAAWAAAWAAGRRSAWDAARDAGYAGRDAGRDAAGALVVVDLLDPDYYRTLTGPLASVIGPEWFEVPRMSGATTAEIDRLLIETLREVVRGNAASASQRGGGGVAAAWAAAWAAGRRSAWDAARDAGYAGRDAGRDAAGALVLAHGGLTCVYRGPDGQPSCGIGHVADRLGLFVREEAGAGKLAFLWGASKVVAEALGEFQEAQDRREPWGEALQRAEAVLAHAGVVVS